MANTDDIDNLPQVPMTEFKTNPSAYLASGAVITNHGRPRAAFIPIEGAPSARKKLDELKAQLLMLTRLTDPAAAAEELAELTATRDAEILETAQ
jgi:hypothetical protein